MTVNFHAYDGEMTINMPYLKSGSLLAEGDDRGVLVEEQFAQAHGLEIGDTLVLRILGNDISLIVRGTVLSPEYIVTSKDVAPAPETFGFVLLQHSAVSSLPLNEMVVTLEEGYAEEAVKQEILAMMP